MHPLTLNIPTPYTLNPTPVHPCALDIPCLVPLCPPHPLPCVINNLTWILRSRIARHLEIAHGTQSVAQGTKSVAACLCLGLLIWTTMRKCTSISFALFLCLLVTCCNRWSLLVLHLFGLLLPIICGYMAWVYLRALLKAHKMVLHQ